MSRETPNPLWDSATDDTFRKALFDYKLVAAYAEKSMGGKRWLAEDIERIRVVGLPLEESVTTLRDWEDTIRLYSSAGVKRTTIDRKIEETKTLAHEVIHMINQTEQKPNREVEGVLVDQYGHVVMTKWNFGGKESGVDARVAGQLGADDFAQQTDFMYFDGVHNEITRMGDANEGYAIKGAARGLKSLEELEKHNPVGAPISKNDWQSKGREIKRNNGRVRSRSPSAHRRHGDERDRMRSKPSSPPGRQRSKYSRREPDQADASGGSTPKARDTWRRDRDGPLLRR